MEFLLGDPVILALTILALLLVLSIPIGIIQQRRKKSADASAPHRGSPSGTPAARPIAPSAAQQDSRFMGTRFDLLILVFGILVLAAIVMSVISAFR